MYLDVYHYVMLNIYDFIPLTSTNLIRGRLVKTLLIVKIFMNGIPDILIKATHVDVT